VTMSVTIRSAALDDYDILAIERQSPAAHWTAEQYHKLVGDALYCSPSAHLRWARTQGAGSPVDLFARGRCGRWEIENVVVAAEFLRRGVATS